MTTGRINQVTAFRCATRRPDEESTLATPRAPPGSSGGHVLLHAPNGTALVTALRLDFALLRTELHTPVCNPFTHTFSSVKSTSLGATHPATATTDSSLGRLADPGAFMLHSTLLPRLREITGATPLQPSLAPVPCKMRRRSIRLRCQWNKHSQRQ